MQTIETQLTKEVAMSSALRENLQGPVKTLEEECTQLKSSLKQLHQWVNAKLRSVQEEMDICKVIYSLHGSLSQVGTLTYIYRPIACQCDGVANVDNGV